LDYSEENNNHHNKKTDKTDTLPTTLHTIIVKYDAEGNIELETRRVERVKHHHEYVDCMVAYTDCRWMRGKEDYNPIVLKRREHETILHGC
jgi:hypothetical protein